MNASSSLHSQSRKSSNQNIQVYVRVRPINARERGIRSNEVIDVVSPREIVARHSLDSKLTKKFTFDRAFAPDSRQNDVYNHVVAPLIEEVLAGYNCTVFAYGQTGTGKTHTMIGTETAQLGTSWDDDSDIGIIPRALSHLFDELRMTEMEFSMRISYLELYNEELCDLLSSDDSTKIRIFDDSMKKGSVIIQGLEEIPVHSKDDVYKLLEKGKERRKTAKTLMNAQSSRSHTVFSILVHIRETGIDNEEMLKIGKLNLVDLAGSENVSKAGNEKAIRVRETVNINQSLLTLGRVITALVERTPHVPYRESKLTRLLQESLGGRTKTSIIATISPGHKDIEETLSTLEYAHRAKNIQNKPEVNQKLTQRIVLKEYTEEIDKLKRDLMAARDKNGIYLPDQTYMDMTSKMDAQSRELNEKVLMLKALKDELINKEKIFNEVSLKLVEKSTILIQSEKRLENTKENLLQTKQVLQNAKRRYEEKKVLLQEQVKTEEILTNQATEILKVADTATQDTEKLHTTLERRKDVDRKIETASECIVALVSKSFQNLDEDLKNLCKGSNSYMQMILNELSEGTNKQNRLLSESNKKIIEIGAFCEIALQKCLALQEKSESMVNDMNAMHTKNVATQCTEICMQQQTILEQLSLQFQALQRNSTLQEEAAKTLYSKTNELLNNHLSQQKLHSKEMQAQMCQTQALCEESMMQVKNLQNTVDMERVVQKREHERLLKFLNDMSKLQEQFAKDMHSYDDAREEHLTDITIYGKKLHKNVQDCQNKLKTIEESVEDNYVQHQNFATQQQQIIVEQMEDVENAAKQNNATGSDMMLKTEEFGQSLKESLKNCSKTAEEHQSAVASSLTENMQCMQEHVQKSHVQHSSMQNSFKEFLTTEHQSIINNNALARSMVKSVQNDMLEPYAQKYNEVRNNSLNDVMRVKQNELKTYQPTGSTPSKREYRYPRVLAATAAHANIIKRFRQERNYSDTENTIIIPEDNEMDIVDESIQNVSAAEKILNSTPIGDFEKQLQIDVRSQQLNASNINNTNNNNLSVDVLQSNTFQTDRLNKTPKKNVDRNDASLGMNKENKI